MTHLCEFEPIAAFVAAPHVAGAVNVLYVMEPAVVPYTSSPLLPELSHANWNTREFEESIPVSWLMRGSHPKPVQYTVLSPGALSPTARTMSFAVDTGFALRESQRSGVVPPQMTVALALQDVVYSLYRQFAVPVSIDTATRSPE